MSSSQAPQALTVKLQRKALYTIDQLRHLAHDARRRRRQRQAGVFSPPILCYPRLPEPHAVIRSIAAELGSSLSRRRREAAVAVWWENATLRSPDDGLRDLATSLRVLNLHCRDISKSFVAASYERHFGVQLSVDPRRHAGLALEKAERNASHEGRAVVCPAEPRPGYTYQKLINNVVGHDVEDIRVPVLGKSIPFVYLKYRPVSSRYANINRVVFLDEVRHHLSVDECTKLLEMCKEMGLDYGELDVLRDRDDGNIYVVDVNQTPWGPPNHLVHSHREEAIHRLAEAFSREFLQ